jgi:hypothetical protein
VYLNDYHFVVNVSRRNDKYSCFLKLTFFLSKFFPCRKTRIIFDNAVVSPGYCCTMRRGGWPSRELERGIHGERSKGRSVPGKNGDETYLGRASWTASERQNGTREREEREGYGVPYAFASVADAGRSPGRSVGRSFVRAEGRGEGRASAREPSTGQCTRSRRDVRISCALKLFHRRASEKRWRSPRNRDQRGTARSSFAVASRYRFMYRAYIVNCSSRSGR